MGLMIMIGVIVFMIIMEKLTYTAMVQCIIYIFSLPSA
jgi:hypothetical protein